MWILAELWKYSGPACVGLLAEVAAAALESGFPNAWMSGRVALAAKGSTGVTSFRTARGVLCSPVGDKLVVKVMRAAVLPALELRVAPDQFGTIRGGGTAAPPMAIAMRLQKAKVTGRSVGVLFVELAAAL